MAEPPRKRPPSSENNPTDGHPDREQLDQTFIGRLFGEHARVYRSLGCRADPPSQQPPRADTPSLLPAIASVPVPSGKRAIGYRAPLRPRHIRVVDCAAISGAAQRRHRSAAVLRSPVSATVTKLLETGKQRPSISMSACACTARVAAAKQLCAQSASGVLMISCIALARPARTSPSASIGNGSAAANSRRSGSASGQSANVNPANSANPALLMRPAPRRANPANSANRRPPTVIPAVSARRIPSARQPPPLRSALLRTHPSLSSSSSSAAAVQIACTRRAMSSCNQSA